MSGLKSVAGLAENTGMMTNTVRELPWSEQTAAGIAQTVAWEAHAQGDDLTPATRALIEEVAFEAATRMFTAVSTRLHGISPKAQVASDRQIPHSHSEHGDQRDDHPRSAGEALPQRVRRQLRQRLHGSTPGEG